MDTIESLRSELARAERDARDLARDLAAMTDERDARADTAAKLTETILALHKIIKSTPGTDIRDAVSALAHDLTTANARLAEVERATVVKCAAWLEADAAASEESLCQDQPLTEMARQVVDGARIVAVAQRDTAREMRIALMPAQASEERPNHGECCAYCHGSGIDRRGNFCGTNTRALMPAQASEPATGGEG